MPSQFGVGMDFSHAKAAIGFRRRVFAMAHSPSTSIYAPLRNVPAQSVAQLPIDCRSEDKSHLTIRPSEHYSLVVKEDALEHAGP
jgi:hypothetical protein